VAVPATDAGSGVSHVALSHDGVAWSVRSYAPTQTVTLPSTNGTRTVYAKWRDGAGNWSAVKSDSIVLDTVAPTATAPRRGFVQGSALAGTAISTRIPWSGSDATSGIARYELQHQLDGGAWTTVSTSLVSPTTNRTLASERTHRFRVRAIDKAGNVGVWMTGDAFRVSRLSETSTKVKYGGSWPISKATAFLGGQAKAASKVGAKASTTFTGRTIAWVASTGPTRGKAEVLVNGTKVATVDLYSASGAYRKVVWVGSYTTASPRTVSIRVLGTSGHPRVDLDAFITAN
jgi:hypothetical protein